MKGLSVRTPWTWFIEHGLKSLEIRCWTTDYRGPLIICAGSRPWDGDRSRIIAPADAIEQAFAADRGTTICVVDLVDVRPATPADARAACILPAEGDFAWVLANPVSLPRAPFSGKLRMMAVDLHATFGVVPATLQARA